MSTTRLQTHPALATPHDTWEWAFCPAIMCRENAFLVRANAHELWQIRATIDLPAWWVAAGQPLCPACATTLTNTSVKGLPEPH
jgi:hypothetical protein